MYTISYIFQWYIILKVKEGTTEKREISPVRNHKATTSMVRVVCPWCQFAVNGNPVTGKRGALKISILEQLGCSIGLFSQNGKQNYAEEAPHCQAV